MKESKVKTGAALSNEVSPLEKKNSKLAYEIALESMVLLKNNGALPVKKKKVALYGNGVQKTIKGGTGSGEVNERHAVTIYEGMKNAGFDISSKSWLQDYETEFETGEKQFDEAVKKKLTHALSHLNLNEFSDAFGMNYEHPYGREITEADVAESDTDVCLYVVSRQSGESMDRNPDDFMFHLVTEEIKGIDFCATHYKHTIVVLNVGASMDISPIIPIEGVTGILYMGMLGSRGGDAFASIISGEVSPSGHLTETWVRQYDDVPYGREFGKMNANVLEQDYKEGIYVGYRYYDTFAVPIRYPFGYGLSYTNFDINGQKITQQGTCLEMQVKVKNTGHTYAGKEVVQVYVSCPQGVLEKPYQQLAAFAKTKMLKPGEEETLSLEVDLVNLASFFESDNSYRLEPGEYIIRLGNSSDNTSVCAVVVLEKAVITSKHKALQMRPISFEEMQQSDNVKPAETKRGNKSETNAEEQVIRLTLDTAAFQTMTYSYEKPYPELKKEDQQVLDRLSVEECIDLVVGDGLDLMGKPHDFVCPGAVGYSTSTLVDKGVPLLIFSDGPAGLRIQRVSALKKNKIRAVEAMGNVFNYLPKWMFRIMHANPKKSTLVYQFTTAFPVGNSIAQSWNTKLLEEQGEAVSAEMAKYGINFWLAPGVNIHRNPLNGRNYEYYSEDPYLTGKLAAAVTRGVEKRRGTYVTLKHFCCNSQEEQRGMMSSNVSERTLREIYLRGFEIAVRESHPTGIMTAYNKVNGVYNANYKTLLEDVARAEWGYDGLVVTDWMSTSKVAADAALCMTAGNEMLMSGMKSDKKRIREALKNGEINEADVRKCAGNVIRIARQSDFRQEL